MSAPSQNKPSALPEGVTQAVETIVNDMVAMTQDHRARIVKRLLAAIASEWPKADLEQLQRYREHLREKIYIDATPDAELPVRILSAHIDDSTCESIPPALGEQMNKWQAERNVILREAISRLSTPVAPSAVLAAREIHTERKAPWGPDGWVMVKPDEAETASIIQRHFAASGTEWAKKAADLYELAVSLKRHAEEVQKLYKIDGQAIIDHANEVLAKANLPADAASLDDDKRRAT